MFQTIICNVNYASSIISLLVTVQTKTEINNREYQWTLNVFPDFIVFSRNLIPEQPNQCQLKRNNLLQDIIAFFTLISKIWRKASSFEHLCSWNAVLGCVRAHVSMNTKGSKSAAEGQLVSTIGTSVLLSKFMRWVFNASVCWKLAVLLGKLVWELPAADENKV